MTEKSKRATIYLDEDIHRALKIKAAESSTSVSELVNSAVKNSLAEDAEDLDVFDKRSGEKLISYEEMVKKLKRDGQI
ncbi:MAG TPA: plasmid partition protein ParG [bacterium]|jgi:plasmid stability protein